jgi:hypothetical protein
MDNPDKRGSADRSRVNVNEPHEVRYWTDRFGCSEDDLRLAVKRVGVMVADVEAALAGKPAGQAQKSP